ncbi:MAG: hypothetical protein EXS08_05710 [Planctomycetes bacterium]|nr:hypothetical protein [Planctomycetota bacterium]
MAERETERRASRPALLLGSGRWARETGAALAALSALDGDGERRLEPCPEFGVADLEQLLEKRPLEGLLILESARVPAEDIGFVRRFLERHAGWRLLAVGADKQEARALLALPRALFLRWPPDLEELRGLLLPTAPAAAPAAERAPTPKAAPRANKLNGGVDVGDLLEDLLASAALQGSGAPRYQFRGGEALLVHRERGLLQESLGALVELARHCAGGEGLVRAGVDPAGDAVVIGLDFPRAGLSEKELPSLLERAPAGELGAELSEALAGARAGAARLREIGARVELGGGEPGRVRCEVRLPTLPAPVARGRSIKPEDPFA